MSEGFSSPSRPPALPPSRSAALPDSCSFHSDLRFPYHPLPDLELLFRERPELRRGRALRLEALACELFADVRTGERRVEVAREPLNDGRRHFRRAERPAPGRDRDAGHAGLGDG